MSKLSLVKVVKPKARMTQKTTVKKSPESMDKKGIPQWFKDANYEEPHSLDGWFYKIYDRVIINELIANGEMALAKEKFLAMVSDPIEIRKQTVTRRFQGNSNNWQYDNEFKSTHVEDASIFDVTYQYNQLIRDGYASKVIGKLERHFGNITDINQVVTNKSIIQRFSYLSQQKELLGKDFPLDLDFEQLKLVVHKKAYSPTSKYIYQSYKLSSSLLRVDLSANDKVLKDQFDTWLENARKADKRTYKKTNPDWYKWHKEALLQISDLLCWQKLTDQKKFSDPQLLKIIWPDGLSITNKQGDEINYEASIKKTWRPRVNKVISKEGLEKLLYLNEFNNTI